MLFVMPYVPPDSSNAWAGGSGSRLTERIFTCAGGAGLRKQERAERAGPALAVLWLSQADSPGGAEAAAEVENWRLSNLFFSEGWKRVNEIDPRRLKLVPISAFF